ncbi:unnamed protein product [Cuscuta campestris]|uniref:Uncharacterized protein n=1 Tax=Cuscuta campestris TaxID=132261 RepID=A0A484LRS9_9ASTE|nr:unnamed protein product [Cuscuta campestris]
MVKTRSNANQPTENPPQGETSATGGRCLPISVMGTEVLIQRIGITTDQFKEVVAVLTPNQEIVVDDITRAHVGGKAGPAESDRKKKKKTRCSQKKKENKPNGKAMIEDDLSRLDEEGESSSFERASTFDRLGDPKQKKSRTLAFVWLQDNRSA